MHFHLIAVGTRMPAWIQTGFLEYTKRLPAEFRLNLIEITACKHSKHSNAETILRDEGERILEKIPKNSYVIALDINGKQWNTAQLAKSLQNWQMLGKDVSLLVGGSEGLAPTCLLNANEKWSLSSLTFPHPLVRVIIAEQLYRALSLAKGHPYHR